MKRKEKLHEQKRKGAIVVLVAVLAIPLFAMVAFAVDYGNLLRVETDLQRAADAAVLAAVQDIVPAADGSQGFVTARATIRTYAGANLDDGGFTVLDADIAFGRYDTATIYSNFTLLNTGTFDTVRVTLRRDATANSPVSLFFGPIIGLSQSNVTATATASLRKGMALTPGSDILPFAFHVDTWNAFNIGNQFSVYGDQRVEDNNGNVVPGNWGTVDIGDDNNSTADLSDQIRNGLRQQDLNELVLQGRIPNNTKLEAPLWVQSDPGLSAGLKHAVQDVHGTTRIIPLYDSVGGGGGNNAEFHIVAWGVVDVVTSNWTGNNKYVTVRRSYTYDGALLPQPDLSNTSNTIDGSFTSPVLVE